MKIIDFTEEYIAQARQLAAENYREEKVHVQALPEITDILLEQELTANGLGVAAVENGRLLGFWGCAGPWEREYGSLASGSIYAPACPWGSAGKTGRALPQNVSGAGRKADRQRDCVS